MESLLEGGYFWVPGTWVLAPRVGFLWTPGYWGWVGNAFLWNPGYWGPRIGFYGGVNYGFGYGGYGYQGGYWNNGAFFYNRSVNNITNVTNITNVYNKTVINNVTVNNVSYNGGNGGLTARPTAAELAAAHEPHIAPTTQQTQQERAASTNRALLASVNHGKPPIAATSRPGVFSGRGVVAAKTAAPYHPPARVVANRTERLAPSEAIKQPPRPKVETAQSKRAPVQERAVPAERRVAPPAQLARPESVARPPAAPHRVAPNPSGEKPKEE